MQNKSLFDAVQPDCNLSTPLFSDFIPTSPSGLHEEPQFFGLFRTPAKEEEEPEMLLKPKQSEIPDFSLQTKEEEEDPESNFSFFLLKKKERELEWEEELLHGQGEKQSIFSQMTFGGKSDKDKKNKNLNNFIKNENPKINENIKIIDQNRIERKSEKNEKLEEKKNKEQTELKEKKRQNGPVVVKQVIPYCLVSFHRVCCALKNLLSKEADPSSFDFLKPVERELVTLVLSKLLSKVDKIYTQSKRQDRILKLKDLNKHLANKDLLTLHSETLKSDFVCVKRKEEKLKFIMKNTVKFFRRKYLTENNVTSSLENELLFLESFYEKQMKRFGMKQVEFSDPLCNININNPTYRSMTNEYMQRVFCDQKFKEKFFSHLETDFKGFYDECVLNKIETILIPLKKSLEREGDFGEEACYRRFMRKLEKKKTFKFPWFDYEIDNAMKVFKNHVEKILDN